MTGGQNMLDGQPGTLPDIRTNVRGITFVMAPPGTPRGEQLAIRCDPDGEVWVSIHVARATAK
jgi:hypothetical protein